MGIEQLKGRFQVLGRFHFGKEVSWSLDKGDKVTIKEKHSVDGDLVNHRFLVDVLAWNKLRIACLDYSPYGCEECLEKIGGSLVGAIRRDHFGVGILIPVAVFTGEEVNGLNFATKFRFVEDNSQA